jgi:DUF971 family protein
VSHPVPIEVELVEAAGELRVAWSDGHRSRFALAYLRGWCPCAKCQGHFAEAKVFVASKRVRLNHLEAVGGYGMKPHWSDGHTTGILSFDYLREIEVAPPGDGPTNAELLAAGPSAG